MLGPNRKPVAGWFAYALRSPRLSPGEIAVTPEQLAALEAKRTRKRIDVAAGGEEFSWTSGLSGEKDHAMPIFDRFWWLRWLGAALAAVFGLLVFVRLVVPALALSRFSADTWVAAALGVGLLTVSGLWARSAGPARDRKDRRERALSGDRHAIPAARRSSGRVPFTRRRARVSAGTRSRAPSRSSRLAVYWRAAWYDRMFAGFMSLIFGGCVLIAVAFGWPLVRFLVTGAPTTALRPGVLADVILLGLLAFSIFGLYWSVPPLLGERPGVEVKRDGVFARRLWGMERFVRWEDARLFEVSGSPRRRTFRLYGSNGVALWRDREQPPHDAAQRLSFLESEDVYVSSVPELLDAIAERITQRTGLVPRTFSRRLASASALKTLSDPRPTENDGDERDGSAEL